MKNEDVIRKLYQLAADKDVKGFEALFTADGYVNDISAGMKFQGKELGQTVVIYATAFPDMHRELYNLYVAGDVVVVELSLNGTHNGPLILPLGTLEATGKEMHAPCCDVFHLENGKVKSFHCYAIGTAIFAQLGVLENLAAAFKH